MSKLWIGLLIISLSVGGISTVSAYNYSEEELVERANFFSIPDAFFELLRQCDPQKYYGNHLDFEHGNPFFLQGDFDGDGINDFLVKFKTESPHFCVVFGDGKIFPLSIEDIMGYKVVNKGNEVMYKAEGDDEMKFHTLQVDAISIMFGENDYGFLIWVGDKFYYDDSGGC